MATVIARFEPNKKDSGRGIVYYRIYKGHNRRMEFSSRIRLLASSWDETTKTIKGEDSESYRLRAQMESDLSLLNQIIAEDLTGHLTMGDIIDIFKHRKVTIENESNYNRNTQ